MINFNVSETEYLLIQQGLLALQHSVESELKEQSSSSGVQWRRDVARLYRDAIAVLRLNNSTAYNKAITAIARTH